MLKAMDLLAGRSCFKSQIFRIPLGFLHFIVDISMDYRCLFRYWYIQCILDHSISIYFFPMRIFFRIRTVGGPRVLPFQVWMTASFANWRRASGCQGRVANVAWRPTWPSPRKTRWKSAELILSFPRPARRKVIEILCIRQMMSIMRSIWGCPFFGVPPHFWNRLLTLPVVFVASSPCSRPGFHLCIILGSMSLSDAQMGLKMVGKAAKTLGVPSWLIMICPSWEWPIKWNGWEPGLYQTPLLGCLGYRYVICRKMWNIYKL